MINGGDNPAPYVIRYVEIELFLTLAHATTLPLKAL
jgi:hypothetical protein